MWEIIKTIIIGIVQGLTEFLPVSSSGHIRIFKELFGMDDVGIAFDILLHLGTFIAVCIFYFKDIIALITELFSLIGDIFSFGKKKILNKERPYRVLLIMLIVTTIPTAIAGLLLEDLFDTIFTSIIVVGAALLLTAVLMTILSHTKQGDKTAEDITFKDALVVGLCQSCALVPGLSRSGSTIFGGRISGFNMQFAVKYSFLCSLPTILGAIVLKIGDLFETALEPNALIGYAGAFVAAIIVGLLSLKMLDMMAKKKNLMPFAYYCTAVGIFCVIYGIVA